MILKAFAVYDLKALNFGVPFFMSSVGAAVRGFADLANDAQSSVNKHPEDYQLFEIGEYDDAVGLLKDLHPSRLLAQASDFMERKPAVVSKGAFPSVSEIREVVSDAAVAANGGSK